MEREDGKSGVSLKMVSDEFDELMCGKLCKNGFPSV